MTPPIKNQLQESSIIYMTISPTAHTDGRIPARGYAGRTGRIDEIARDILSIHRGDSLLIAVLLGPPDPPKTILYKGGSCHLTSERQVVIEIKKGFKGKSRCMQVSRIGPLEILHFIKSLGYRIILLTEEGSQKIPISARRIAYILGSHVDIPPDLLEQIERYVEIKASIGPLSYQVSQVIAYLEWEAERCRQPR